MSDISGPKIIVLKTIHFSKKFPLGNIKYLSLLNFLEMVIKK